MLVAKQHRNNTGEGQEIDISLYESLFRILDTLGIVYDRLGVIRERSAFDAPHAAPHSHYPTGDDKWVAIACSNDKLYRRLCQAMERTELAHDPRFETQPLRVAHRREIDEIVTGFTKSMKLAELCTLLDEYQVPASPINSIVDIFDDPHFAARNTILTVADGRGGNLRMPGIVPVMSRTPGQVRHAGRAMGADNEEVYQELLGLTPADLATLREGGVI